MLTQKYLKDLFTYCPDTGIFTRIKTTSSNAKKGMIAGCVCRDGYERIYLKGRQYESHRLAWLYMTGSWPKDQIDHINRVKTDNRFSNLREATIGQNQLNQKVPRHNTSGYKGVCWDKNRKKWRAYTRVNNKQIHIGFFKNKIDAHVKYIECAKTLHGEFFSNETIKIK